MIGGLARAFDNLFGRGEAAVTVPPLDGALMPNRALDEAARAALEGVDCLVVHGGELLASAGVSVFAATKGGRWSKRRSYDSAVACFAPVGYDGLAVALASGEIVVEGGRFDGRRYRADGVACITAISAAGNALYVTNGSATNGFGDWQRDLLERNASGSIWRIDLDSGNASRLAEGLAWPAGLAVDADGLAFSEAWKHRLVRIDPARPEALLVLHEDLPAYPGRIAPAADGWWLALFAPRSQLVEFVLREPAYRKRMMAEVPQQFWVAPRLRSGGSFYESLQGGGVKHLGMLKPWAPTMSAGLCVKLDRAFHPRSSLQSRADGNTHGVTGAVEHDGRLFVAARGDGVVVSLPLSGGAA
ncbi:MAG: strictosidine synthase [Rhizobiaceae bacterium]|nr:strictosidine synthase [Rhizobiaceae bacterium]